MGAIAGAGITKVLKSQTITTSSTWVRPYGVNFVELILVGGGGGGGGGGSASGGSGGGGGGGGGGQVLARPVDVSGDVTVTIGAGGAGGAGGTAGNPGANGAVGGHSMFGVHRALGGGYGAGGGTLSLGEVFCGCAGGAGGYLLNSAGGYFDFFHGCGGGGAGGNAPSWTPQSVMTIAGTVYGVYSPHVGVVSQGGRTYHGAAVAGGKAPAQEEWITPGPPLLGYGQGGGGGTHGAPSYRRFIGSTGGDSGGGGTTAITAAAVAGAANTGTGGGGGGGLTGAATAGSGAAGGSGLCIVRWWE